MNIETRIKIEKKIAKAAIAGLLAAGYAISVHDGEEVTVKRSIIAKDILDAMFTTDEDILLAYKAGELRGEVNFIYGNDGYDVIADYSTVLEPALKGAEEEANKLEEKYG